MDAGKATFLLGAGVSRPSGGPTVEQITRSVLDESWHRGTDERFFPGPEHSYAPSNDAERLQLFLRMLHEFMTDHLRAREGRAPNYEDLFWAATQLLDDETEEWPNPMIAPALLELAKKAKPLLKEYIGRDRQKFSELLECSTAFIQWAVFHKLAGLKPKGLDILCELSRRVEHLTVATLNHDLLVERQLHHCSVDLSDGFEGGTADYRGFAWCWNSSSNKRIVLLLKLHGSIDWFLCDETFGGNKLRKVASVRGDPEHIRDTSGRKIDLIDAKPLFLTGTTVKERNYGAGVFGEMFAQFRAILEHRSILICCGYGWADKGLNIRINDWLLKSSANKVVILHPNPEKELSSKPFWHTRWDRYRREQKLVFLPRWLCDCTIDDLSPYFEP